VRTLQTTRTLRWVPFLLFPVLVAAQKPAASTSPGDLQIVWEFDTGGLVFSTPTLVGDLLVVGSRNVMIRALDKKTDQVKWKYDIRKDGDQRQFHGTGSLLTNLWSSVQMATWGMCTRLSELQVRCDGNTE
jgi:glucose dehydrogenase